VLVRGLRGTEKMIGFIIIMIVGVIAALAQWYVVSEEIKGYYDALPQARDRQGAQCRKTPTGRWGRVS